VFTLMLDGTRSGRPESLTDIGFPRSRDQDHFVGMRGSRAELRQDTEEALWVDSLWRADPWLVQLTFGEHLQGCC